MELPDRLRTGIIIDMSEPTPPGFTRNRWAFGIGTLGRDMIYILVAQYLVFYLTEALDVPDSTLWWVTALLLSIRVLDALLDPLVGALVDSTRTRWGQFKPWLVVGSVLSGILTVLLFTDLGLTGTSFLVVFALLNVTWGVAWALHDISYWSQLPALSVDPGLREKLGSTAKVFASLGVFTVVVGIQPLVSALSGALGGDVAAWRAAAIIFAVAMVAGVMVNVAGVREDRTAHLEGAPTSPRELWRAIAGNDQLLWTATAFLLFMVGYGTTGAFGLYFFKYAYGDETVFPLFAAFVGLGQLAGFATFPLLAARWPRKTLYTRATLLAVAAYAVFLVAPMNLAFLAAAAFALFFAAAYIMLLMIVFQADTIEYGQYKLGKRNNAVTFALQPFINKVSGAISTAIVSATVILSGINDAGSAADVTAGGIAILKVAMMALPAALIVIGYLVWRARFTLDETEHARIVAELAARGDLSTTR